MFEFDVTIKYFISVGSIIITSFHGGAFSGVAIKKHFRTIIVYIKSFYKQ
jgi:hypothetical protein